MNNSKYIEFEGQAQVTQVGEEFKSGVEANAEIERLLGFESQVIQGMAHRRVSEDPKEIHWVPSPDWCGDDCLAVEELEKFGVVIMVMETVPLPIKARGKPKAHIPEHVAVFELGGVLYATVPCQVEKDAAACALWFVASQVSHK